METLTLSTASDDLLQLYYRELMEPSFAPAELMTYQELLTAVRNPGADGLMVMEGSKPVAGLVVEEYLDGRLLLLAYVVVAASLRGQGTGARLIATAVGSDPRPVLAEIEDPRFHAADEHRGDPVARARFYERLGSRLLPLPYVQPSFRPGSPRVPNLLLITIPSAAPVGDTINGVLVGDFLTEYYSACEGEETVAADESFRRLDEAARSQGHIQLGELGDLDSARTNEDAVWP